jgi:hypothetical protein
MKSPKFDLLGLTSYSLCTSTSIWSTKRKYPPELLYNFTFPVIFVGGCVQGVPSLSSTHLSGTLRLNLTRTWSLPRELHWLTLWTCTLTAPLY